jgi:cell division protein FtsA
MARNVAVGIDVGTYQVKVVIAEAAQDRNMPRILGVGFSETKGLRHGYIIHQSDAISSIDTAIRQAEKTSGVKVQKAYLSIGGIGLSSVIANGSVSITRADSEITDLDVKKAIEVSQQEIPQSVIANRRIIHAIPLAYKIDGKPVLGRPIGMKGMKLEARTLFITCLEHHLNEIIQAVEEIGIEVADVMASPLAASLVMLTKAQKMAGCVLCNIGSETVSIVVYENNIPMSLEVFPIGSNDITNDIALGLKIPLEEAEQIKLGALTQTNVPRKKLEEIVSARLSDIFELIEAHLKKIGKSGLLPAGIILTGGGSGATTIEELAKAYLRLPSKVGSLSTAGGKVQIKDSTWSVAYGLCIWGLSVDDGSTINTKLGLRLAKKTKNNILNWIKQFLP